MVQPTTPSSTCACIIDPIVNSAPYQLISGACSAIGSLAQRIATCVATIFTAIVNFVKSCICGAAEATPQAAAITATPPRAAALAAPVPLAPVGVDVVEEGKLFLAQLFDQFEGNFEEGKPLDLMRSEEAGNAFLANLLVHDLVMDVASIEGQPVPFMVTRGMGYSPFTFINSIERLRTVFNELDPAVESSTFLAHGTNDDSSTQSDLEEDEVPPTVGETLRMLFVGRKLTIGLQDNRVIHSSGQELEQDVFDPNPDNSNSKPNVFYAQLNTLARNFINSNPTFVAAANAFRAEYIQDDESE